MPDFKIHSETGVAAGYIAGSLSLYFVSSSPITALLVFAALYFGAIFPDIDSDSGRTIDIIFNILSVLAAFIAIILLVDIKSVFVFFIPPGVYLSMKFIVSKIFKYYSRHRGIYHSLPMPLMLSLTLFTLLILKFDTDRSFIISLAFFTGYFIHLLLDEINSIYDIEKSTFDIKKSLGTAITLKGNGLISTIMVYSLIFGLFIYNFSNLKKGFKGFLSLFGH